MIPSIVAFAPSHYRSSKKDKTSKYIYHDPESHEKKIIKEEEVPMPRKKSFKDFLFLRILLIYIPLCSLAYITPAVIGLLSLTVYGVKLDPSGMSFFGTSLLFFSLVSFLFIEMFK